MAKNMIADGTTIEFTATKDHKSGDLVELGNMIAIAHENVTAGDIGLGHAVGVWSLPKAAAVAIEQGESVYIKNGVVSKDNTGTAAGKAWVKAEASETSIDVKING
ncbi:DUF2190 family protein [Vibrio mimicus]|uniref:DUF2190 family protein n=1 Tax=Vibrio mimicus TaxID=674 RepID=UPI0001BADE0D|nr:capsid cement protein [Vibrio mimicus]EEY36209.1 putative RecA/RadA recombinase [Vibrio mimicus MB451]